LFAAEARRVPGLLAKPIIDIMLGVNFEEGIECSEED